MENARLQILIVEDEPAHAEAILRALQKSNLAADVRVVGTLREFREAVAAQTPNFVLLDLNLPDGQGLEVLTAPPEQAPFPVLIMTSFGNEQIAVELMKAGAHDYVVKSPEAFAEMPRTVERGLHAWNLLQERKRAEEALHESEERYRSVFENSLDAVVVTAPDGRIFAANQAACRLFGRSEAEICRLGRDGLVDPHDVRLPILLDERARLSKVRGELRFVRADGYVFPGEISSSAFDTPQGVRTCLVIHDLTERKCAELNLHRAAAYNRALIEAALDPLVTIQPDGRIADVNAAAETVTGKPRHELIGTEFSDYFTEPEKARNGYLMAFAEGTVRDLELGLRHANGHVTPVVYNATVYRGDEGQPAGVLAAARDITERKKAEETLRENEEKYHQLFEVGLEAIFLIDNESGRLLEANSFASEMYGYAHDLLLSMYNADLSAEPEETSRVTTSTPEGSVIIPLRWHRRKDGSVFPVEISGRFFTWKGRPVHVAAIRDITARMRVEEALRHSEERFRLLVENAPEAIFVQTDHRFAYLNRSAVACFGAASADELLGTPVADRIDAGYRDLVLERMRLLNEDKAAIPTLEEEYLKMDGSPFAVEVSAVAMLWGDHDGALIFFRDITERRQVAEQIRIAKEEWERTFDSVPDLICILDEHHIIRRANRAMAAKLGLRPEELVGGTCYTLVHGLPHPPAYCPHVQLLLDRREHTVKIHEDRLGGDYQVSCFPLRDKEGQVAGAVHFARDITASNKLESQLQQAMKMEAVGRLAGGVAHDFNNMLSVILGYADLALTRLNPLEPLYKDIQEIQKAGRRSADMTRQLLAFSRKQIIMPKVIDLNQVIDGQRKMLGRLIGEDIDLQFKPAPELWPLKVDPSQIDQILANLAVNARDALVAGGTITIETANGHLGGESCHGDVCVAPGDHVVLTFSDTGAGMDTATQERIFEPFFTTKEEGRGTGLGLSTVYGIVKQYDGTIQVFSRPGAGTTFKIYLPRFQGAAEAAVDKPAEVSLAGSETVLIVEDEGQILNLARQVLAQHGYRVLTARSPGEACLLVEKHAEEIHLLLTDVIMPGMNGKELRERVARLKPGIKTIYMSGYTAETIAHRGIIEEGVEFLQKPFTIQSLAEKVRRVLDA